MTGSSVPPSGGFPERLKAVRALRQMKQITLATRLGVHEMTVSRWERGVARPTLRQEMGLCEVLDVSPEELGLRVTPSEASAVSLASPPSTAGAAAQEEDPNVKRREFVERVLALGGALALAPVDWEHLAVALARPSRVSAQLLLDMRDVTREYLRLCHTVAPSTLLPSVETHLAALRRLQEVSDADVLVKARMATAQTAMTAAWLLMQAGDRPAARSRFDLAEELVTDVPDTSLRAQVLTACSFMETGVPCARRSWRALAILDEAEMSAPPGCSFVRAYLHARRAEERAAAGDALGAERDLDGAERCVESAAFDPDAIYAHRQEELWVDAYRASVHRLLDRPSEAAAAAARAVPTLRRRAQAPCLSDWAGALVQSGDLDTGCGLLVNAVDAARTSGNPTYLDRVRGIRAGLEPHRGSRAVRYLDEVLAAAA